MLFKLYLLPDTLYMASSCWQQGISAKGHEDATLGSQQIKHSSSISLWVWPLSPPSEPSKREATRQAAGRLEGRRGVVFEGGGNGKGY